MKVSIIYLRIERCFALYPLGQFSLKQRSNAAYIVYTSGFLRQLLESFRFSKDFIGGSRTGH